MTAVFNFDNVEDNTTYYTHYIRWIIEPKSKQKNYLLLQQHTTKTEKRNEKTWCLPWRKNKEKNCQEEISILVKKSLQLEYLFIISEIFLEFIHKLHVLKMSMKPNHPLKSQLSIDWKVKTKRIPSKQRNSNLASKNYKKKIPGKKTQTNYVWLSYWEKRKTLYFFSIRFTMTQKIIPLFRTRLKNNIKRTLPTIY